METGMTSQVAKTERTKGVGAQRIECTVCTKWNGLKQQKVNILNYSQCTFTNLEKKVKSLEIYR